MTFEHGLAAHDVAAFAEEYNERNCKDVVEAQQIIAKETK